MEGPDDKVYVFVRAAKFGKRVPIRAFPGSKTCVLWEDMNWAGLMNAEQAADGGGASQDRAAGDPDRSSGGECARGRPTFFLLEEATVVAGGLYGIDPFDQPGIELKLLTKRELEK